MYIRNTKLEIVTETQEVGPLWWNLDLSASKVMQLGLPVFYFRFSLQLTFGLCLDKILDCYSNNGLKTIEFGWLGSPFVCYSE